MLAESKDPQAYWRKLKQRLKEEGNETVTNCHALKMQAADGKMRSTDVADAEQMLRTNLDAAIVLIAEVQPIVHK